MAWFFCFHKKKRLGIALIENRAPAYKESTIVTLDETVFTRCLADFSNIKTGLIEIEPQLWLRTWTTCIFKDGDGETQTVTLPLWLENSKTESLFITVAVTAVRFDAEKGPSNYDFVNELLAKVLVRNNLEGMQEIEVVIGKQSSTYLTEKDPLADMLASSVGNQMLTFGKTSYVSALPTYPGLEFPIIFPYRINSLTKNAK